MLGVRAFNRQMQIRSFTSGGACQCGAEDGNRRILLAPVDGHQPGYSPKESTVRTQSALFAAVWMCASHLAVAQSTLGAHSSNGCKDFQSTVDHDRPAIADWVSQPGTHPVAWSDSRVVVNAAEPTGLIVDECRKPG